MIFTHSIISGYVVMQGNYAMHIPMLVTMIYFVKDQIPSEECQMMIFETRLEPWLMFSAAMHIYLAFMSILRVFTDVVDKFPGCFKSTQLVAVLLQMMNLCNMLHLVGVSTMRRHKELAEEANQFRFWILLEILMVLVTILVPTIYLFARSLAFREQIIDKEASRPYGDDTPITEKITVSLNDFKKLQETWKK